MTPISFVFLLLTVVVTAMILYRLYLHQWESAVMAKQQLQDYDLSMQRQSIGSKGDEGGSKESFLGMGGGSAAKSGKEETARLADDMKTVAESTDQADDVEGIGNVAIMDMSASKQALNDLSIREVLVKSAYNACYSGTYVSTDMLRFVLSRGCRFLDFQIFSVMTDGDEREYVSVNADNNTLHSDAENRIPLAAVLQNVAAWAFSSPSPNPKDPLFLHLRITKSTEASLARVARHLDRYFHDSLYRGKFDKFTKLGVLQGKTVVIVDSQTTPNLLLDTHCDQPDKDPQTCANLASLCAVQSNTTALRKYTVTEMMTQAPLKVTAAAHDRLHSDVQVFQMVVPTLPTVSGGTPDVDPTIFWKDYPTQFLCMRFYMPSRELRRYERVFAENRSAFVPMTVLL